MAAEGERRPGGGAAAAVCGAARHRTGATRQPRASGNGAGDAGRRDPPESVGVRPINDETGGRASGCAAGSAAAGDGGAIATTYGRWNAGGAGGGRGRSAAGLK